MNNKRTGTLKVFSLDNRLRLLTLLFLTVTFFWMSGKVSTLTHKVGRDSSISRLMCKYLAEHPTRSKATRRAKRGDLGYLQQYLKAQYGYSPKLGEITPRDLSEFDGWRLTQGDSPATRERRLATIKHFFRLYSEQFGLTNSAREIKPPRVQRTEFKGLDSEHRDALVRAIAEARTGTGNAPRTAYYLGLIMNTGLRASEPLRVRAHQLDMFEKRIFEVSCKGDLHRDIYTNAKLVEHTREYLQWRDSRITEKLGDVSPALRGKLPLIISFRDGSLNDLSTFRYSESAAAYSSRKFMMGVGIPRRMAHLHVLRHTLAHTLLDNGVDIKTIQTVLGHSSIEVTMIYLTGRDDRAEIALEGV